MSFVVWLLEYELTSGINTVYIKQILGICCNQLLALHVRMSRNVGPAWDWLLN